MRGVTTVLLVGALLLAQVAWGGETPLAGVELKVRGMMCGSCAAMVEKTLRALPGVSQVTVVLKQDRATVIYDPRQVTPQGMIGALRKAGYEAVAEPEPPRKTDAVPGR